MSIDARLNRTGLNRDRLSRVARRLTEAPVGGGLLLPTARLDFTEGAKNLLSWSGEADNPEWAKVRISVTADAVTAPDGTTTADKLVEDTNSGSHHLRSVQGSNPVEFENGQQYTISAYFKAAGRDWAFIRSEPNSFDLAFFDLANGTLGTVDSEYDNAAISDEGNGWHRCSVTITANETTTAQLRLGIAPSDGTFSYTGDGSSGVYIWGMQVQEGGLQPYHKTTDRDVLPTIIGGSQYDMQLGSAAGADTNDPTWEPTIGLTGDGVDDFAEVDISSLIDHGNASYVVRFKAAASNGNFDAFLALQGTDGWYFRNDDTKGLRVEMGGTNINFDAWDGTSKYDGTFHVIAFALDRAANEVRWSVDGGAVGRGSHPSLNPSDVDELGLFKASAGGTPTNPCEATVSHLEAYNRALSDAELQEASQRIIDNPTQP